VILRLRLALLVARPAVVFLLALSGLVGLALGGVADDPVAVGRLLLLVVGFVVYAVTCNDLADLEVDRVNLPGDARRPLVTGSAAARDVRILAAGAAVVTASAAATEGLVALLVTLAGLALATAYSVPPCRIAGRGVVAPLVLPALFVGLPFILGVLAARPWRRGDLVLLMALYVGFIGRIVLKDFRDVVGDRLFGKRTFLVRHGRRLTCALSATCWTAGTTLLIAWTPSQSPAFAVTETALGAAALALITALAVAEAHQVEERIVSALAILGRAGVAALFVQIGAAAPWAAEVTVTGVGVLSLFLALQMLRHGPRQRRLTFSDVNETSSAVASRSAASPSSVLRGRREPGKQVTSSTFSRPELSIRQ
jgi:4-hydroxybenzoate polyprenyltransferase